MVRFAVFCAVPNLLRRPFVNRSMLLWDRLKKNRVVALLAPEKAADCVAAYEALHPQGVILEIALRTQAALDGIRAIRAKHPEALVLAGTVLTRHQAECAIDAGAAGIVTPDYIPVVVEVCARADLICIPGGIGDIGKQLVQKAELYNCELDELRMHHTYQWIYKLFPAMAGFPANLEMAAAWKPVYKDLNIVYAGGVKFENLGMILNHDPQAIVCASALVRDLHDPKEMANEAKRWIEAVKSGGCQEAVAAEQGTEKAGADEPAAEPVAAARPAVAMEAREREVPPEASTGVQQPRPCGEGEPVVTFGEVMLRLSPPKGLRFGEVKVFDGMFGGAEANVAVALANFGLNSRFVTALPEHSLGQAAVNALRSFGVDTSSILRFGERVGVYFLEHGASQRPSKVIYDRAGSSVSALGPGQVDWAAAFEGARWFHWTGITPALSSSLAGAVAEAIDVAKSAGLRVSCDLNFRSRLWSREKAAEKMTPLMEHVDVVVCNEEDAEQVFGISAGTSDVSSARLDIEAYHDVARQLVQRFGLDMAAITLRESLSASDNVWSACLFDGKEFLQSKKYPIHVVDRVGGGDAFTAGLIYGLLGRKSARDALEFAAAASCLKQTVTGDFNLATVDEVNTLAKGDASGRIQR